MAKPWSLITISYFPILLIVYGIFSLFVIMVNSISTFYCDSFRCHRQVRVTLHGDILKLGYYATRQYIGKPAQEFTVVVDTGSNLTFIPCSEYGGNKVHKFRQELSSTYLPLNCNVTQCTYYAQYGEGSTSNGLLGEDFISFTKGHGHLRAVFGCETEATGAIRNQTADGIMGLGRGKFSIVDHLVKKGVITDSFSLCFGGMDFSGGYMILGRISPPSDMVFSPSNRCRSKHYNVELKDIHVAGRPLQLNPTDFDEDQGTILDSATTFSFFPRKAFHAFKNAILEITKESQIQLIEGSEPDDICFSGAEREAFPAVDLEFINGQKLSLSPENYLFRHENASGSYCLGIYQGDYTILGAIIVRNTLVTYDRENDRIGFWKTNCSEIWEWERPSLDGSMASNQISTGSCQYQSKYSTQLGDPAAASFSPIADKNKEHHDEL